METGRTEIPGSAQPVTGEEQARTLNNDVELTVTVVLRPKAGSSALAEELLSGQFETDALRRASEAIGADEADVEAVEAFARAFDLEVLAADAAKRTIKLRGSVQHLDSAFGVHLAQFADHIGFSGPITVPTPLATKILAVLGLDTRPVARPRAAPTGTSNRAAIGRADGFSSGDGSTSIDPDIAG